MEGLQWGACPDDHGLSSQFLCFFYQESSCFFQPRRRRRGAEDPKVPAFLISRVNRTEIGGYKSLPIGAKVLSTGRKHHVLPKPDKDNQCNENPSQHRLAYACQEESGNQAYAHCQREDESWILVVEHDEPEEVPRLPPGCAVGLL